MRHLGYILFFIFQFPLYAIEDANIHIERRQLSGKWTDLSSSHELNVKKLFELLGHSLAGEKLLREANYKAAQMGLLLTDVVKVGESSLTDTTLVRKFSPHSPEHVVYESKSVVYIGRSLSWSDALLDLAHELTHFTYRESFNPYSESFNAKEFIKSTIEGQGGEAQAFLAECRVLRELFSSRVQSKSQCQKVIDEDGELSLAKAVELFYHVGSYFKSFQQQLLKREMTGAFSYLKGEKINFISSAYGVPYPLAALMEYDLVLNKVCENDKKRLDYMRHEPKRGPASASLEKDKFQESYTARCVQK